MFIFKNVQFTTNSIKMQIQNPTKVPAHSIGLETRFYIVGQYLYTERKVARRFHGVGQYEYMNQEI
jgi:hypothetical protein